MDIKDIMSHLKREWELVVLAATVAGLLVAGCHVFLEAGDGEVGSGGTGGVLRSSEEVSLSASELGFLDSPSPSSSAHTGPLGLPSWMERGLKPAVSRPRPVPVSRPVPVASVSPRPVIPSPVPVSVAPKFKRPAPELKHGILYFAEFRELSDGSRGGLFELSYGDDRRSLVLRVGEQQRGLLLDSVSARRAELRDARGRRVELKSESEVWVWTLGR